MDAHSEPSGDKGKLARHLKIIYFVQNIILLSNIINIEPIKSNVWIKK